MTLVLLLATPPAGGVSQTLAVTSASTSTMTGVLFTRLGGTSASVSALTGRLAFDLKGTLASTSAVTGKFGIDLKGTLAGTSGMTGAALRTVDPAGTSAATSGATGLPRLTLNLAGTSAGSSTTSGTITLGLAGHSSGTSAVTGNLGVRWVMGGTSGSQSVEGLPLLPQSSLLPASGQLPGYVPVPLKVVWGMAGTSASTSSLTGGYTDLAGVASSQSSMGYPQTPGEGRYPGPTLFPGVLGGVLTVTVLGQQSVLITLTASEDVHITLTATADVNVSPSASADVLTTLGVTDA